MTTAHLVALVLLVAGCAVLLLSALALWRLPGPFARVHALSPATSLGAPLVALGLAVDTGPGRAAVKLLVIAALLMAAGPVTSSAIGRVLAQQHGEVDPGEHSGGSPQ